MLIAAEIRKTAMSKTTCTEQLSLFSVGKQEVTVDFAGGHIVSASQTPSSYQTLLSRPVPGPRAHCRTVDNMLSSRRLRATAFCRCPSDPSATGSS